MSQNDTIQVPGNYATKIREFYKTRLAEIENEAIEIRTLLKDLDNSNNSSTHNGVTVAMAISQPNNFVVKAPELGDFPKTYNPKWANQKKAQFIIRTKGRALTSREIVDIIVDEYDPNIEGGKSKFLASMSSVLSGNCKDPDGIFTRTKNDIDDYIYNVRKK
jgi:hypothetical protein